MKKLRELTVSQEYRLAHLKEKHKRCVEGTGRNLTDLEYAELESLETPVYDVEPEASAYDAWSDGADLSKAPWSNPEHDIMADMRAELAKERMSKYSQTRYRLRVWPTGSETGSRVSAGLFQEEWVGNEVISRMQISTFGTFISIDAAFQYLRFLIDKSFIEHKVHSNASNAHS